MKKNLLTNTVNNKIIQKKFDLMKKENIVIGKINKFKKLSYYLLGISVSGLYIVFILNSSGLMKKLQIDKKYHRNKKYKEEIHGIDSELNNEKFKEFDKKWGINHALDKYEENLKFGNKELNKKEKELENFVDNDTILEKPVEDQNKYQIKLNSSTESNPLEVESNIIFDSRLNKNN